MKNYTVNAIYQNGTISSFLVEASSAISALNIARKAMKKQIKKYNVKLEVIQ